MATHVYANDDEIACKSTDGVAVTAFPDPCWSPPPPSLGPVVIPYGNVAYAKHIKNGTKTVFIKRKMVAVEDKAYFSKSYGNEPATQAFNKGFSTRVIKGKAYFRSWSPDVFFEGRAVDRHKDLVTHNHGSFPANTPTFPYKSRGLMGSKCKNDEAKIEKACKPDKDDSDAKKELKKKSKLTQLLQKLKKNKDPKKKWHWTDDHCTGLEVSLPSHADAKKYLDEMGEVADSLPGEMQMLSQLEGALKDMALNAAGEAAAKWVGKAALKQAGGSALPAVGNAAMAIWSVVDAVMAVGDVMAIQQAASDALDQLKVLKDKIDDIQKLSDDLKNFNKLSNEDKLKKAQEIGQNLQDLLATLNACTRAKKCQLVPKGGKQGETKREHASGASGGCCPGQTGHHIIYDNMMKNSGCTSYDYNNAPTVCVEGNGRTHGSHGRIHRAMDRELQALLRGGKVDANNTISMDDAINAAANSHASAFPTSSCSRACIVEQLKNYFNEHCANARPKVQDGGGHPIKPDAGDGGAR